VEVIRIWSGSENFLKNSPALQDRASFYSLVYISRKSDRIFVKILSQMYLWTTKSQLVWKLSEFKPGPYLPRPKSALSECFCFLCILKE